MSCRSRADIVMNGLRSYLERKTQEMIDARNQEDPGLHLPHIASFQQGYRDIFAGLRDYPGLIVIERGREPAGSFWTRYKMLVGLAVKGEDADYLQDLGAAYEDILEDAILSDNTLGGICTDSRLVSLDNDCVSGVYIVSVSLEMDVDRGGFL